MLGDFADLEIGDESSSRAREDRMRIAFEKSKATYAHEQVFTEPGWYDPPEIPPPTKLHIRNIDYSLNNLCLKREYSKALVLALSEIEVEESNLFGDSREVQLIDIAIRCALKTKNYELAGQLSDKTRTKWSSNVGLASTSAEAYLAASRPRDALSAILTAISIRGPQMYTSVLYRALESLSKELRDTDILEPLLSFIRAHMRRQNSVDKEIPVPLTIDSTTATNFLEKCAIIGADQERLITLLCHKPSGEIDGAEEKSVRTL